MGEPAILYSAFSINEWFRLDHLASKYDRKLKVAYTQTAAQGNQVDDLYIRDVIAQLVVEVGLSSAKVYGMVFNTSSPVYLPLIDRMTDGYMKVVNSDEAREKVRQIIPTGLSLAERRHRLDVFGLDARSAVRIEHMRQEGKSESDINQTRFTLAVQRGNLIALTEVNRIINAALETLWIDNLRVSKAEDDIWWFERSVPNNVESIAQLPSRARKEWVTRRDDRVCNYCLPIEGVTARLGADFDTEYGYFPYPPIHPRCRCYMVVSVR